MAEFTPGPWKTMIGGGRTVISETADDFKIICDISGRDDTLEVQCADAKLIAAAPELREALESLMRQIDNGCLVRDVSHDHEKDWAMKQLDLVMILQKSQAALAKAEGKSNG